VAGKKTSDTFEDEAVNVNGRTCTCSFNLVVNGKDCKKMSSGSCNKDCQGSAKEHMLTGESGNKYELNLWIKKGQVKFRYCKTSTTSKPPVQTLKYAITIPQTWSQEPNGYNREALIQIPKSSNKKKFPVVIDLHGFGAKGSYRFGQTLKSVAVLVAPTAYQPIGYTVNKRQWNINADPNHPLSESKAPDVEFILKLLEVVRETVPVADMEDVTIIGSSMGGAMLQRLMIEVPSPQPFHKAIPLYGMLNTDQYHDGRFWMSSEKDMLTIPVNPPKPGPEFIYFHGDQDKTVTYKGGKGVGGNIFLGAQIATFTWATYWGETGPKLEDEEGTLLDSGMVEYSYLGGRVVHYKLPGASHNLGKYKEKIYQMIKDRVIGGNSNFSG